MKRLRSWWQQTRKPLVVIGFIAALVVVGLIFIEIIFYGTGFADKTLWDWLQLLIIPALLAFGAVWFTSRQNHDLQIAREQREHDIEITLDNQREAALQGYIDKMSSLLLEKNLGASNPDDEVRKIATAQTVAVLPNLDPQRKRSVVKFLHDTGLITKDKSIVDLMEADLSGADLGEGKFRAINLFESELNFVDLAEANLSVTDLKKSSLVSSVLYAANLNRADLAEATLFMTNLIQADLRQATLVKADLTGAWLKEADLGGADLCEAHMFQADLRQADLSSAKIEGADLGEADLTGAKVTKAQLDTVKSLKGATMPDGSIHS